MAPWFRGYAGQIEDLGQDRYKFTGTIRQTGDNEVEITELPIRMWTQDFKDKLEEIIKAEKVPSFVKDYVEYNTPTKVHFIIKMEDKHMKIALEKGLEETFKLTKTMATSKNTGEKARNYLPACCGRIAEIRLKWSAARFRGAPAGRAGMVSQLRVTPAQRIYWLPG